VGFYKKGGGFYRILSPVIQTSRLIRRL
jgi:hypothetical protein